jgi:hypothetical protein
VVGGEGGGGGAAVQDYTATVDCELYNWTTLIGDNFNLNPKFMTYTLSLLYAIYNVCASVHFISSVVQWPMHVWRSHITFHTKEARLFLVTCIQQYRRCIKLLS